MDSYDVIVVGGGTAGAAAAIAAGRQGAKTLVIEQLGSLGGTQTNGWVTPMMPNYMGDFKLNRGVNLDILAAQSAVQPVGDDTPHGDAWYDPVMLGYVLDQLATAAGVECLFNTLVIDAHVEDGVVTAVEVATRGGRFWIKGKTFIDASGDAELAMMAKAEMMEGNEDGVHQPMTLRFMMAGIEIETMRAGFEHWGVNEPYHIELGFGESKDAPVLGDWVREGIAAGVLEEDDLGYFQFFTMNGRPGELAFNAPRIAGLNPLDSFEMSLAYQVGRAKIFRISKFLQRWFPGFEKSFVSGIAPLMGIRESRRIVGDYVLTAEDHQNCRKFQNSIARNRYPVDIHLAVGIDFRRLPKGEYHDIPYDSIVVKNFDNLWVAGRCFSADFVAQSSARIQPVCRSMGEAAGVAAAIAARDGLASRAVPYSELAEQLDLSLPAMMRADGVAG
ncbi:MAG: FAD-dependent oxidoreductase [Armatimonadetes bacterium]|nr:FAD-dependent oxidoreductase [Armatimonadota bacterium]